MKKLHKSVRWFAALLALALMLAPAAALAEGTTASEMTKANIWGVLKSGSVVYRDLNLSKQWVKMPRNVIVNVIGYGGSVAVVKYGAKTGCVELSNLRTLSAGDALCANRRTRAYQAANLHSRSVSVPKGVAVELVALSGNCAKVKRGEYVAYMYIGHLMPQ